TNENPCQNSWRNFNLTCLLRRGRILLMRHWQILSAVLAADGIFFYLLSPKRTLFGISHKLFENPMKHSVTNRNTCFAGSAFHNLLSVHNNYLMLAVRAVALAQCEKHDWRK